MTESQLDRRRLLTARLTLRAWTEDDAPAALAIYGDPLVAKWLSPVLPRLTDEATMRSALQEWRQHSATDPDPLGHWALVRSEDDVLVGGLAIRELETDGDLEIAWQLARPAWGHG